jgi:2Fe-2S ferredoxin
MESRALTRIEVLPHPQLCPEGLAFEAPRGALLVDALLARGIAVEHACEKVCACATCHVHLRTGGEALAPADEDEEDQLGEAWGVDAQSRLACCARVCGERLVVELPRFSRNHARER